MARHRLPKGPMPYVLTTWTSFRNIHGWEEEEDEEGAEKEGVHGCLRPRTSTDVHGRPRTSTDVHGRPRTSTDVHGHHKLEENLSVLKDDGRRTSKPGLWAYGKGWRWTPMLLRPAGGRPVAIFYPFGRSMPYAPRRKPYAVRHTPMAYAPRKNKREIAIFHYQIWFPWAPFC
jgi:hypothetical protein